MSALKRFDKLVGQWKGTSQLWLSPQDEAQESDTTSSIALQGMGKFVAVEYTWSYKGDPQEGFLLLGTDKEGNLVRGVWIDSWHNGHVIMLLNGPVREDGIISVQGSYAAPPGPDWGWKIDLDPGQAGLYKIVMYNIPPEKQPELAVIMSYTR